MGISQTVTKSNNACVFSRAYTQSRCCKSYFSISLITIWNDGICYSWIVISRRFCDRRRALSTNMFTMRHWGQSVTGLVFLNLRRKTNWHFTGTSQSARCVPNFNLTIMPSEPRIVVTGYGPFGPHTRNTSWQAVKIVKGWMDEFKDRRIGEGFSNARMQGWAKKVPA